jgi:hypothetical protein
MRRGPTSALRRWNSISLELLARRHLSRQNGPILANSRNAGETPLAVRSADSASSKKTRTWRPLMPAAREIRSVRLGLVLALSPPQLESSEIDQLSTCNG